MLPKETHILLIEDMKGVRLFVKKLLNDLGYLQISEASDGNEACPIVEGSANARPIGLVISDLNMPGMSGLEFLKWLRVRFKPTELPFIFLTTESDKGKVVQALRLGANGYMLKPASPSSLTAKLDAIWSQVQAATPPA
jgi:two-component system, chemotaxis family, chemotaxis protein CheY